MSLVRYPEMINWVRGASDRHEQDGEGHTFLPVKAATTSGPVVPTLPNIMASSGASTFLIVFPTR